MPLDLPCISQNAPWSKANLHFFFTWLPMWILKITHTLASNQDALWDMCRRPIIINCCENMLSNNQSNNLILYNLIFFHSCVWRINLFTENWNKKLGIEDLVNLDNLITYFAFDHFNKIKFDSWIKQQNNNIWKLIYSSRSLNIFPENSRKFHTLKKKCFT